MFAISTTTTTSTTTEEGETTGYDIITSIHEMASCIL
jgi:hypothetical protein